MSNYKENILIVDDDVQILELIQRHLAALNYYTFKAVSVKEALSILKDELIHLLITDLKMPEIDGMELVKYVSEHFPSTPILVVTGYPSINGALEVMKSGAVDYLTKPFTKSELLEAVTKNLKSKPQKAALPIAERLKDSKKYGDLIGRSSALQGVINKIERVKNNRATILISGESGTGKELVARAIHYMGKFKNAPFIAVNCGAIPDNLLESELFGYTKGAFTGAGENRSGFFQAANKGTLFLDEIGSASLGVQLKLLRAIQEKEVIKIGAQKPEKIEIRVIAATNLNLQELIDKKLFRKDLYYRLTVVEINVPPLRERKEDIPLLVDKFLFKYGVEYKDRLLKISPDALKVLKRYQWPGNVRELENAIQQAIILCDSQIEVKDLPEHLKYQINFDGGTELLPLKEIEKQYILKVLKATDNNKSKAAKILGITRKTLASKIS